MTCIIVALRHDLHADAVVDKIATLSEVVRIDPFESPVSMQMDSANFAECLIGRSRLKIDSITGIFCRVALESIDFRHRDDPVARYAAKEYIGALSGFLLNVDEIHWVNFPWHEGRAEGKLFPMIKARNLGISVPRFFVTNDAAILTDKSLGGGKWIIKPLTDSAIAKQAGKYVEIPDFADFDAPYTAVFTPEKISSENIDATPVLIQERIDKKREIRVVAIDSQLFATAFDVEPGDALDGRLSKNRSETVYELPATISEKVLRLIHSLQLRFATLDFVVDASGTFWLLDVNPSGNWLWQELGNGLPISEAIARALCKRDMGRRWHQATTRLTPIAK